MTTNVAANVNLAAAPGFRSASLDGFVLDAPLGGFWNFAFASDLDANASVRVGGQRIFSWSPNLFRLGFRISNFRVSAAAQLNAQQPDRPILVRATLSPQLTIGVALERKVGRTWRRAGSASTDATGRYSAAVARGLVRATVGSRRSAPVRVR